MQAAAAAQCTTNRGASDNRPMEGRRGICWRCAKLDMRDIRVAGRPQVSYTCRLHFRAPNIERFQFFERLVGGDDGAPPRIPYWRMPMRVVGDAR